MQDDLIHHLVRLERSLHGAATGNNPWATGALLAPDFREFGASGRVWTRPEILAALESRPPAEIRSGDFTCQMLSPRLALLTYVSCNAASGRRALRSSLWRFDEGAWRIVFHQGTPIQ